VKVGQRIRVGRLQEATHAFRKNGYAAKVAKTEWGTLPGASQWQWLITEIHRPDTKRKDGTRTRTTRRIESVHGLGTARIEAEVKEKSQGVLEMYGPECPPFLNGDNVRTSYKRIPLSNNQFWTYGVVGHIADNRMFPSADPRWSFGIFHATPLGMSKSVCYGYDQGSYYVQSAASKRFIG
jgi:hypothetical protein